MLKKILSPYNDRRVASVYILGIAQGLPWVMIGSMLTLWLKESGISRANISYAALIFTVYAINFLWSPVVEFTQPKFFSRFGRRQSWIVLCQLLIVLACFGIAFLDPTEAAKHVVLMALLIATFSATQDIAIDAYRVDSFANTEGEKISAGAGVITAGWWTGYAGVGALPLILSDHSWSWPQLYILLGAITFVLCIVTSFLPKPEFASPDGRAASHAEFLQLSASVNKKTKIRLFVFILLPLVTIFWAVAGGPAMPESIASSGFYIPAMIAVVLCQLIYIGSTLAKLKGNQQMQKTQHSTFEKALAWILTALVAPLREFFTRNGFSLAIALLSFILLFKLGEAFLGRMSILFYKEVGFSNTQIATYSKLITWWLTVIFALIGGLVNARFGLLKGLFVSGVAMACTNLLFALIAVVGPVEKLYALAIVLDGFAAAWSTVAFVSFISLLCNHAFSATQYALMASLSNLGRTSISSISGQVVDWLGGNWALFFVLTTLMIIPSLLILFRLRHFVRGLENRETAAV